MHTAIFNQRKKVNEKKGTNSMSRALTIFRNKILCTKQTNAENKGLKKSIFANCMQNMVETEKSNPIEAFIQLFQHFFPQNLIN